MEFDASIKGAHVIPEKSKQLAGLNLEIVEIINTAPGQNADCEVSAEEQCRTADSSRPSWTRFRFTVAGPTTDITTLIREDAATGSVAAGDAFNYTFTAPIPATATGSFLLSADAYRNVVINPGQVKQATVRESGRQSSDVLRR